MAHLSAWSVPFRVAWNYALPPRCPACGDIVEADRQFCGPCWGKLDFLTQPLCACCGVPLDHVRDDGLSCGACLAEPPPYDSARAVLAYGEIAGHVAIRLKYGRRLGLARLMADHMARLLPQVDDPADWLLVPVPLHRWRMWRRGFNQSALVVGHLSRISGIAAANMALCRTKATPMLGHMNGRRRRDVLRGALAPGPDAHLLKGRRVLLIDDVLTSGATAQACTRLLRSAGAAQVHLICWARVTDGRGG